MFNKTYHNCISTYHSCKIPNSYENSSDNIIVSIHSSSFTKSCNKCLENKSYNPVNNNNSHTILEVKRNQTFWTGATYGRTSRSQFLTKQPRSFALSSLHLLSALLTLQLKSMQQIHNNRKRNFFYETKEICSYLCSR